MTVTGESFKAPTNVEIAGLINGLSAAEGIQTIVSALEDRFPWSFRAAMIHDGAFRPNVALYEAEGNKIADNVAGWIEVEVATNGNVGATVKKWKSANLVRSKQKIDKYVLTAQLSADPSDLMLVKVDIFQEVTHKIFGSRWWGYEDLDDLMEGYSTEDAVEEEKPIGAPCFHFSRVDHLPELLSRITSSEVARRRLHAESHVVERRQGRTGEKITVPFLEAYPDFLNYRHYVARLIEDWGRIGPPISFGDFWNVDIRSWTNDIDGTEEFKIMPRPADLQAIPKIELADNLWDIMKQCEIVDTAAGFPFAWFFHAVYGNRMSSDAIRVICEGIEKKKIQFPSAQNQVLMDWAKESYAF